MPTGIILWGNLPFTTLVQIVLPSGRSHPENIQAAALCKQFRPSRLRHFHASLCSLNFIIPVTPTYTVFNSFTFSCDEICLINRAGNESSLIPGRGTVPTQT